ncbi:MAG: CopG family transcriptional regulator [Rickettsiales bacterium]
MRTIIDITDEQVKALDEISQLEDISRAALIRRAIDRMLAEDARKGEVAKEAFGLWSYFPKDGLVVEADWRGKSTPPISTPRVVKEKLSPPPAPVVAEDRFVTEPPPASIEPSLPVAEEQSVPAQSAPPAPPMREVPQTAVDPLAAFFAGVKP